MLAKFFFRALFLGVAILGLVYFAKGFFVTKLTDRRVIIIGVDGLDPIVRDELIRKKKLPTMEFLLRNGVSGVHHPKESLQISSMWSPTIWTSAATGRRPQYHGISEELTKKSWKDYGLFFLFSSDRKVPALWNIFSSYKQKVAVINWWVTYPAEKVNGVVVTTTLTETREDQLGKQAEELSDKLFSKVVDPKAVKAKINQIMHARMTYPEGLAKELGVLLDKEKPKGNVKELGFPEIICKCVPDNKDQRYDKIYKDEVRDLREAVCQLDSNALFLAKHFLQKESRSDLLMTYFGGIDVFSHIYWHLRDSTVEQASDSVKTQRCYGIVEANYLLADNYIGQILKLLNENDVLIVISDHGFQSNPQGEIDHGQTGTHRDAGVVMIYGKGIKKAFHLSRVSLLDIVPTVLYLKNLPIARTLEGKVLFEAMENDVVKNKEPVYIADYNKTLEGEVIIDHHEYPFREELKERFKSLGYMK